MRNNIFLSLITVSFFTACQSSEIGYDIATNTVYTIDGYPISELNVVLKNAGMSFWVTKVDTLEGNPCLKLDSIGENYMLTEGNRRFQPFHYRSIPFIPCEIYEICHASGDASSCILYIFTDKNSRVMKVMKRYEYEVMNKQIKQ